MVKRKRSTKKQTANKRSRKSISKIVKTVLTKNAETKYKVLAAENNQLFHNTGAAGGIVFVSNMLQTQQGLTEESRIGDKVMAKGLSIKLWLSNKADRPNVMYRIMVVATPPDQRTASTPATFWEGDTGNKMLDHINVNRYRVVKSKYVTIGGQDTAFQAGVDTIREKSKLVSMYIPMKDRKVVYNEEAGFVPKYQRDILNLVVVAYDAFGTLTTDNIASFAFCTKFYFKDI